MKNLFKILILVVLLPSFFAQAKGTHTGDQIFDTIYGDDMKAIEDLYLEFRQSAQNQPDDTFWAAYIAYRLGPVHLNSNKAKGQRFLQDCVDLSKKVAPKSPLKAEAFAISSLCYGQLIGANPFKAAAYGSASMNALDTAFAVAPNNPHVLLVGAINDVFTPAQWGGDIKRALVRLEQAQGIANSDPQWQWLLPDIHAYYALALGKNGRFSDAQDALVSAQTLTPDFSFLSLIVSPAIERMAAKQQDTAQSE